MVVLRVCDKDLYVKGIDDKTDKVVFTTEKTEAEDWHDEWRAGTRIQFLKAHVKLGNISMKEGEEEYLEQLAPCYV
jgi:hypothetical protein